VNAGNECFGRAPEGRGQALFALLFAEALAVGISGYQRRNTLSGFVKLSSCRCRCSKIMSPLIARKECHPSQEMVTLSQQELQRVKVIENAVDGA
jgi:hypothetical protein